MDPLATRRGPSPGAPALTEGLSLGRGRYVICEMLGSGGQGYVYRAFDHERDQDVALKQLSTQHFDNALQLKNEFRFLRDLIHPNLVELHELVVRRELSFFTMALVEGQDFLSAIDNLQQARASIAQLLDVLAFLHDNGRLHRDVNPRNVLLDGEGRLTLLDFGISGAQDHIGHGSGLDGTPRYTAPELYRGLRPSPKSDGYSAGLMLYEALTGEYPFPGDRVNPVVARDFDPAEVRPDLPQDLRALCCHLLRVDPTHRATPRTALDQIARNSYRAPRISHVWELSPRMDTVEAPWVGRTKELTTLQTARERSHKSPRCCYVEVSGPSGIGKSALVDTWSHTLEETLTLRGRCSEHELVPHQALDGIVRSLVEHLSLSDGPDAVELLPPFEAQLLCQLFPDFRELPHLRDLESPELSRADEAGLRWQAYHELAKLLGRLGAVRDLVIIIDDLQWADADSVNLLCEVFGGTASPPCLLVLVHRLESERSPALRGLFAGEHSLPQNLQGARVELEPLPLKAARELLERLTHGHQLPTAFADDLLAQAEGSPLVICEAAAEIRSGLPTHELRSPAPDGPPEDDAAYTSSVARVVARRVDRLSASAVTVLELLAVASTPLSVSVVARAVDSGLDEMIFELRAARLVVSRRGGGRLSLAHDQFRRVIVDSLGGRVRQVHADLARLLTEHDGDPATIARHYFGAGDLSAAASWAIRAADRARHVFALRGAVPLLEMALGSGALSSAGEREVRLKLAHALAGSGRGREAAPLFAELAGTGSSERSLALRRNAAEQWLINGQVEQGIDMLKAVQREVGLRWPESQGSALAMLLVQRLRLRYAAAEAPSLEALGATGPGSAPASRPPELRLEACRAAWSASLISTMHGAANSARYLADALKSGHQRHIAMAYAMEATYRATAGSKQQATVRDFLDRSHQYGAPLKDPQVASLLAYARNQCDYLLGRFRENATNYPLIEVQLLSSSTNSAFELNSGRIFYASSLFNLGRHRQLDECLTAWARDGRQRGDDFITSAVLLIKAQRTALETGDLEATDREIDTALALWRAPYFGFHQMTAGFARCFSRLALGQPERALEFLSELVPELRRAHMMRVQLIRTYVHRYEALALLSSASRTSHPTVQRRLIGRAKALARSLRAEGVPWAAVLARQISASASLLEAPDEDGLLELEAVAHEFDRLGLRLHAAAARVRVQQLAETPPEGGEPDRTERFDEAAATFDEVGCVDWLRALDVYSPPVRGSPGGESSG